MSELDVPFTRGSGNVFADLGLPDAELLAVKADLEIVINVELQRLRVAQVPAAERAALTEREISQIGRMRLDSFSEERLRDVLGRLVIDVEIHLDRDNVEVGTLEVLD